MTSSDLLSVGFIVFGTLAIISLMCIALSRTRDSTIRLAIYTGMLFSFFALAVVRKMFVDENIEIFIIALIIIFCMIDVDAAIVIWKAMKKKDL